VAPDHDDVHAAVVTHPLAVLASAAVGGPGTDDEDPDCATIDGTQFAIVWEREASPGSGNNDVVCAGATYSTGMLSVALPAVTVAGDAADEVDPAIDFDAAKYVAVWSEHQGGLEYDIRGITLDPATCMACELEFPVSEAAVYAAFPQVASRWSAGDSSDGALAVWQATTLALPPAGGVGARVVEAVGAGGFVVPAGPGCGGGGTIGVGGPVAIGNASFAITLSGAAGPPIVLVFSPLSGAVACGPCTLVPLLTTAALLAVPAPATLPIPCDLSLLGGVVIAQWIVAAPSACPLVTV
jgi:hypothetical protein